MSRLNDVLSKKERTIKAQKQKKKSKSIPVYNAKGNVITPEKRRRKKRLNMAIIIIAAIAAFIYIPGLFAHEKKAQEYIAYPDGNAVITANEVLQTHLEEDFDHDGLLNSEEVRYGTSVWNPDSDGDGAFDSYEINVSMTDPLRYEKDILIDAQIKADERNGSTERTPYMIDNVIVWANDYDAKSHGSLAKTLNGYHFNLLNGYAKFPESGYAYGKKDGKHYQLPYRQTEDAYQIKSDDTVVIYPDKLEEIIELKLFDKPFYLNKNPFTDIIATILPDQGFLTAKSVMRVDTQPDTRDVVMNEISKPIFDASDEYRFTTNTNSLDDLNGVMKTIEEEGVCVAISMRAEEYGEFIGIVFGYNADGDLMVADLNTLEPLGLVHISPSAKMVIDNDGSFLSMSYFDFDGFGFHSSNGDTICFFGASKKTESLTDKLDQDNLAQEDISPTVVPSKTEPTPEPSKTIPSPDVADKAVKSAPDSSEKTSKKESDKSSDSASSSDTKDKNTEKQNANNNASDSSKTKSEEKTDAKNDNTDKSAGAKNTSAPSPSPTPASDTKATVSPSQTPASETKTSASPTPADEAKTSPSPMPKADEEK